MKKVLLFIYVPILLILVVFPLFGSGAFADLFGNNVFTGGMSVLEPVNLLLLGIGLTFAGSRG
jgi:hypothetical protein